MSSVFRWAQLATLCHDFTNNKRIHHLLTLQGWKPRIRFGSKINSSRIRKKTSKRITSLRETTITHVDDLNELSDIHRISEMERLPFESAHTIQIELMFYHSLELRQFMRKSHGDSINISVWSEWVSLICHIFLGSGFETLAAINQRLRFENMHWTDNFLITRWFN